MTTCPRDRHWRRRVSAVLPIPVIQVLQVLTIAVRCAGVSGVIARVEARLQGRRGPRVLQPYYDLAKLFRKEALAPEGASWVFLAAPLAAFTCYLTVPLLIPVLTTYPLPLGYMGDILGGGFILSLASFLVAVAALETGSPYAQLGASRAKTFGAITEPVVLFVVFTVGAADRDRPAVRAGRHRPVVRRADHPAGACAGRGRAVHGHPVRDRPDPGGDAHRHQRVRDDRGSPAVRALRPVLRAAEVGLGGQAADPLHDPAQRLRRPVGAGADAAAWARAGGDRGAARQGLRARARWWRSSTTRSPSSACSRSPSSRRRRSCSPCSACSRSTSGVADGSRPTRPASTPAARTSSRC